ncbi:hypothetical protein I5Q34_03660 [Streptomyces sp. AV19]|uniref:hypothetical protein n=1 Tax=Streptomyces sp. AV19 TaxID=2793068 RepID=UPI0018FEF9D9|nr:hypothetical protein [Streptomyces sp. AV19]MBH1933390.1 hypothetical protein [Streptomyces sp. AV19]MDG4532001.1 hypothetical protein [Streptomyces sp. AV19]
MAKRITGADRVIMGRFTARWPDGRCVLVYARHESMAVVASVAVPGAPPVEGSLWEVAGRHCAVSTANEADTYGRWLLCAGWSMSVMPPVGGLVVSGEPWSVDVLKTAVLKEPAYGSEGVYVGRMAFENAEVLERAGALLR